MKYFVEIKGLKMKLRYLGAMVSFISLGMAVPATAQQSAAEIAEITRNNECFQNFKDKNYEAAMVSCQKAADHGKLEAVNLLAAMYENGWGTEKDISKAFDYYKSAANGGLSDAMVNVATMYESGEGVAADMHEAQFYYIKAARAGNAVAARNIANLYLAGKATDIPEGEVISYLAKSAEAGDIKAAASLGQIFLNNKDYQQAARYLTQSAEKADPASMYKLAKLYQEGKVPATEPKIAETLLKGAADNKYVPAQADYGMLLAKTDAASALSYLEEAAKSKEHPECTEELAFIYLEGRPGVPQDARKGIEILEAAAKDKDFNATRLLGNVYYDGEFTEKDLKKAIGYYKTAAENKDASAQNSYAEMLLNGEGTQPDIGTAISWFETSARNGNAAAYRNLGEVYYDPKYGRVDMDKSYSYFMKARDLGDQDSIVIILQRDFRTNK